MSLLFLIRHGDNDYVKTGRLAGLLPGIHLNEHGKNQAQNLADILRNLPVKKIFSSPLERTFETAYPLSQKLGLDVEKCSGLAEIDTGLWTGQDVKKLRKFPEWEIVQNTPSRFVFPEGESFIACQVRLIDTMESLLKPFSKNDIVLCFSHADPIKIIISHYLGMPLDHFQRLACNPACMTIFNISKSGYKLLLHNSLALPSENFIQSQ